MVGSERQEERRKRGKGERGRQRKKSHYMVGSESKEERVEKKYLALRQQKVRYNSRLSSFQLQYTKWKYIYISRTEL